MGTYHYGHLAYGIDMGGSEKAEIAEVDEYGTIDLPWLVRDDEGYPDHDLSEAVTRRLYELIPGTPPVSEAWGVSDRVKSHYGVEMLEHGWPTEGQTPCWVLSTFHYSVDGGDTLAIDPQEMIDRVTESGWNEMLAAALAKLEITPNNPTPRWYLLADR